MAGWTEHPSRANDGSGVIRWRLRRRPKLVADRREHDGRGAPEATPPHAGPVPTELHPASCPRPFEP